MDYKELIIINDDTKIDSEMLKFKNFPNINLLFFENRDEFKKAECFNQGALKATGKILCFYDADVLIEGKYLEQSQNEILNGRYDHIYPFTGYFINIKKLMFDKIFPDYNFNILKESLGGYDLTWNNDLMEPASDRSPGGCNLISKESFLKIGGYDSRFIGWGFEDTDFQFRSKRVNKVKYLNDRDSICWHLQHDNPIRLENPYYDNNIQIFNRNNR